MSNNLGKFIAIEGPDGSGKSTIVEHYKKYLSTLDPDIQNRYLFLKEPTNKTQLGQFAKEWVHNHDTMKDASSVTQALYLFSSSRMELIEKVIQPALASGKIVISDRFALSTAVYQDLMPEWKTTGLVKSVLDDLTKYIKVDATIFCMADPKNIVERLKKRKEIDGFNDSKTDVFFESLNLKYLLILYGMYIDRSLIGDVYVLDANKSEKELFNDFKTTVEYIEKQ